jgi:tripartite-type tricarboxylate transporter receptor subunit TctC
LSGPNSRLVSQPLGDTLGLKGFDVRTWSALAGPAALPQAIVAQLNWELRKALTNPDVRKGLEAIGGEIDATTPAAMRERVAAELATRVGIVDAAKIPKQ